VDRSGNAFPAQVRGRAFGWREQQIRAGIDVRPITLFRPGPAKVVSPEAGLDVSDRDAGSESGERSAKRARRVALDDQQVRRRADQRRDCGGDPADMRIRIRFAGAIEPDRAILAKAMLSRIERGMLAGEDQARLQPPRGQRVGDGGKFDRFGSGADDEPNVCGTQPSP
jgi:hypothetical protein